MYALIRESFPVARKAYRCIWCGESIGIGTKYRHEISTFDGFQDHRWHTECDEAAQAEFHYTGECEFLAYSNPRF